MATYKRMAPVQTEDESANTEETTKFWFRTYPHNLGRPWWPDWANLGQLDSCLLGTVFENYRSRQPTFLRYFSADKVLNLISTKLGWAPFWAIFSQTHLVTLYWTLPFLYIVYALCFLNFSGWNVSQKYNNFLFKFTSVKYPSMLKIIRPLCSLK
jgi:hypothetical protein